MIGVASESKEEEATRTPTTLEGESRSKRPIPTSVRSPRGKKKSYHALRLY